MVKTIVADDMEPILRYLELLINDIPDFKVVAKARNGKELLKLACKYKPDLILTDIEMPELNGDEAIECITNKEIYPKCILITGKDNITLTNKYQSLGIVEIVKKPITNEEYFKNQIKKAMLKNDRIDTNIETKTYINNIIDNNDKKVNIFTKIFKKFFQSK